MIPKWVLTHLSAVLLAGAFVAVVVGRTLDVHHQRAIGALHEQMRVQDSVLRAESHRVDSLKLAFHADTVRLARTLVRYDSIKDTLQVVLHDTTVKRDTLIQVVERYRDRADSTIRTCSLALSACTALTSHQDTIIETYHARLSLEIHGRTGVLSRSVGAMKYLAFGAALGYVYAKH